MKVFEFDPTTGKRGAQIDNVRISSWGGQSIQFQVEHGIIEPIEFVMPKGARNQNIVARVDAGRTDPKTGKDISYRHPTKWIAFCTGRWFAGRDDREGTWEWTILPPEGVVKPIGTDFSDPDYQLTAMGVPSNE